MRNAFKLLCTTVLSLAWASALGFTDSIPPNGLPTATEYGASLLPKIEGAVSWQTLGEVEQVVDKGRVIDKFSPAILALDHKPISIYGFIIPLNFGKDQRHFLLCPVPPHCPFCIPAGPDATIEVLATKPVPYQFEPILVSGKFTLVRNDENGLLYRMTDAAQQAVSKPGAH